MYVGSFPNLQIGTHPDWRAFGKADRSTARTDLAWLARWLGCQHGLHTLVGLRSVYLARGASDILAAIELAGGVQALAAADPDAAACLCDSLLQVVSDGHRRWLPSDTRQRVERTFATLGPSTLRDAAASLRQRIPNSPQRACHAAWLTNAYLQEAADTENMGESSRGQSVMAATSRAQVGLRFWASLHLNACCVLLTCSTETLASCLLCVCQLVTVRADVAQQICNVKPVCWPS